MFVEKQFPKNYTDLVDHLTSTEANVPISDDMTAFPVEGRELYPNGLTTIVPIYGAGGTLRDDHSFPESIHPLMMMIWY